MTLFSSIGILTNLLSIFASWPRKEKTDHLLNLMLLNSILNLIYCLINLIHLINICVAVNGIFCSAINRKYLSQVYDIYIVEFMGSILKLSSSFISILISLIRIKQLKGSSVNFNKPKLIILILIVFILIFLININILFTSKVNADFFDLTDYSYTEFPIRNIFADNYKNLFDDFVPEEIQKGKYPVYVILFQAIFFLNDIVCLVIISILDLIILFKFRFILEQKRKCLANLNFIDYNIRKRKIDSAYFRVTFFIILNSIILFFIRFLNFATSIYVYIEHKAKICYINFNKICSNYLDASEVLFLFSSCFTIIVYYNLNKRYKLTIKMFAFRIKYFFFNK